MLTRPIRYDDRHERDIVPLFALDARWHRHSEMRAVLERKVCP
jgi:hypothetical protein